MSAALHPKLKPIAVKNFPASSDKRVRGYNRNYFLLLSLYNINKAEAAGRKTATVKQRVKA